MDLKAISADTALSYSVCQQERGRVFDEERPAATSSPWFPKSESLSIYHIYSSMLSDVYPYELFYNRRKPRFLKYVCKFNCMNLLLRNFYLVILFKLYTIICGGSTRDWKGWPSGLEYPQRCGRSFRIPGNLKKRDLNIWNNQAVGQAASNSFAGYYFQQQRFFITFH